MKKGGGIWKTETTHLQDYLQSLENVRLFHFGVLIEHLDSEPGSNSCTPGSWL